MHFGMRRIHAAGPRDAFLRVAGRLTGRVLEVGCGTGVLFEDYPPAARVVAVDPDIRPGAREQGGGVRLAGAHWLSGAGECAWFGGGVGVFLDAELGRGEHETAPGGGQGCQSGEGARIA
jgi:SAM-dependent methyltransferase